jgi:hypothetical protein
MRSALFAFLIVAAASAQTPVPQNAAPAGNAPEGKKLFVSYGCYQCHGYEAQGSADGADAAVHQQSGVGR